MTVHLRPFGGGYHSSLYKTLNMRCLASSVLEIRRDCPEMVSISGDCICLSRLVYRPNAMTTLVR